jgi:hypothetical protein
MPALVDVGGVRIAGESVPQAVGFRLGGNAHVVAALWPFGAEHMATVTTAVCEHVSGGTAPAHALHRTMRGQRDRYPFHPYLWRLMYTSEDEARRTQAQDRC